MFFFSLCSSDEEKAPPSVIQHAWTYEKEKTYTKTVHNSIPINNLGSDAEFIVGRANTPATPKSSKRSEFDRHKSRPTSAKMKTVMAPVNATPIGAYTQMKQALGILSSKPEKKKGKSRTYFFINLKKRICSLV